MTIHWRNKFKRFPVALSELSDNRNKKKTDDFSALIETGRSIDSQKKATMVASGAERLECRCIEHDCSKLNAFLSI